MRDIGKNSLIRYICNAPLAQLVEHLTLNQQVAGSSPAGCTIKYKAPDFWGVLYFKLYTPWSGREPRFACPAVFVREAQQGAQIEALFRIEMRFFIL